MIPYIHVPDLQIGSTPHYLGGVRVWPIALHPFGLLVATGVLIGSSLATHRARRKGYDIEKLNSFITWMLVAGFVLSHMIDEVFYHPQEILHRPWSLFLVWEGLSSFGGFIGALVGILAWKYFDWDDNKLGGFGFFIKRPQTIPIMPFIDVILAVFPVAWIFGRSGCSVVHDHPGARASADALLAVAYPAPGEYAPRVILGPIELINGSAHRYDLGLLELMFTVLLSAVLVSTWWRKLPLGTYAVVVPLAYAPVRFVMDFYRILEGDGVGADLRYGSLTFAQWCCIALLVFGVAMAARVRAWHKQGLDLAAPVRQGPVPATAPSAATGTLGA